MNCQHVSSLVEMQDVKAFQAPTFRFDQLSEQIRIQIYMDLIIEYLYSEEVENLLRTNGQRTQWGI